MQDRLRALIHLDRQRLVALHTIAHCHRMHAQLLMADYLGFTYRNSDEKSQYQQQQQHHHHGHHLRPNRHTLAEKNEFFASLETVERELRRINDYTENTRKRHVPRALVGLKYGVPVFIVNKLHKLNLHLADKDSNSGLITTTKRKMYHESLFELKNKLFANRHDLNKLSQLLDKHDDIFLHL